MQFPTLYKRTSKGATQQWTIWTNDLEEHGMPWSQIITEHGQVGGAMQRSVVDVTSGKNIGRKNETTPHEQAALEAEAKWKKQIESKGYREQVEDTKTAASKRPMLAQEYPKHKDKVVFPALMQPKLDGVRAVATKEQGEVVLRSRGNKVFTSLPHINKLLERVMHDGETWDGELYVHGVAMQTTASWIKRVQPDTARIHYHVYDCMEPCCFELRYHGVDQRIGDFRDDWMSEHYESGKELPDCHIVSVATRSVYSHEDVKKMHDEYVQQGYEGGMLRLGDCPYKEGYRSYDLLKVKEFLEDEFKIVGAKLGRGKFKNVPTFECVTSAGDRFDATPRGDMAHRAWLWSVRELLIGKMLTVRFQEWTERTKKTGPVPRFPVGIVVRDYE